MLDKTITIHFHVLPDWLEKNPNTVNNTDENGWTLLHYLAQAEAEKKLEPQEIERYSVLLLQHGANVHQSAKPKPGYEIGDTPFNIAAPSSPIIGRLMTNHWLAQALEEKGDKGINDRSGSHGSTLAQYIAKWSNAEEISGQLDKAIKKGMDIAVQNGSGWTPLHAASAMIGRLGAVKAFAACYTTEQKALKTRGEPYETKYPESPELIKYGEGLTAIDIAQTRRDQAITLPQTMKDELTSYITAIKFTKDHKITIHNASFDIAK
jgi:ankyrin repeat protein